MLFWGTKRKIPLLIYTCTSLPTIDLVSLQDENLAFQKKLTLLGTLFIKLCCLAWKSINNSSNGCCSVTAGRIGLHKEQIWMESIWELLARNSIKNWSPAQFRALCMHCQPCISVTDPSQGRGLKASVLSSRPLCLQLFSHQIFLPFTFEEALLVHSCTLGAFSMKI